MKRNSGKFWTGKRMPIKMRKKMSKAKIGDKNPSKRIDVREKLREAKLGKPSGFKRGKQSEAFKKKMSAKWKGNKNPHWNDGSSFEPYSLDWTETLKRAIRERDNYICQLCSQYGNTVHHIDYDKKNCNPENLITLCNRCNLNVVDKNRDYWTDYFKRIIG